MKTLESRARVGVVKKTKNKNKQEIGDLLVSVLNVGIQLVCTKLKLGVHPKSSCVMVYIP